MCKSIRTTTNRFIFILIIVCKSIRTATNHLAKGFRQMDLTKSEHKALCRLNQFVDQKPFNILQAVKLKAADSLQILIRRTYAHSKYAHLQNTVYTKIHSKLGIALTSATMYNLTPVFTKYPLLQLTDDDVMLIYRAYNIAQASPPNIVSDYDLPFTCNDTIDACPLSLCIDCLLHCITQKIWDELGNKCVVITDAKVIDQMCKCYGKLILLYNQITIDDLLNI